MRKKGFFASAISDFRAKKRFCFKKKGGFHHQFPPLLQAI